MRRMLHAAAIAVLCWWSLAGPASATDPLLHAVQEILADEGYDTGRADGVLGPRTQGAIRAYQLDYGMPVTGIVTPDLIVAMGLAAYASELSGGDGKQYEAPVAAKTEVAASRKLAPLKLIPPIVSGNASIDSDGTADPAPAKPAGDTRQLASAIPPVAGACLLPLPLAYSWRKAAVLSVRVTPSACVGRPTVSDSPWSTATALARKSGAPANSTA